MKYTNTSLQTAARVPFNLDGRIMFRSDKAEMVHASANDCIFVSEDVMRAWKKGPGDVFRVLVCKLFK